MEFSIKDLFSKGDQIQNFLRIWSHLPKKPLMENFILCVRYIFVIARKLSQFKENKSFRCFHFFVST